MCKTNDVMPWLKEEITLFAAVRKAILVALTLPATSCTIERSFRTLREDLAQISLLWVMQDYQACAY